MVLSKYPTLCNICEVFLVDHCFSVAQYIPWLGGSFVESRENMIFFCEKKYYDNHHETVDIIEEIDLICEGAPKGVVDPSWTIGVVDVVALTSGFKC